MNDNMEAENLEADEDNDEIEEGEMMGIVVRLDDGRRIQAPARYLEARNEDDSPAYEDVEMNAGGDQRQEDPDQPMNVVEGSQDRVERLGSAVSSESDPEFTARGQDSWEPSPVQLAPLEFEFYNWTRTRAALRAREDLISVEANWHHYVRSGNSEAAGKLYETRQEFFPFPDY